MKQARRLVVKYGGVYTLASLHLATSERRLVVLALGMLGVSARAKQPRSRYITVEKQTNRGFALASKSMGTTRPTSNTVSRGRRSR